MYIKIFLIQKLRGFHNVLIVGIPIFSSKFQLHSDIRSQNKKGDQHDINSEINTFAHKDDISSLTNTLDSITNILEEGEEKEGHKPNFPAEFYQKLYRIIQECKEEDFLLTAIEFVQKCIYKLPATLSQFYDSGVLSSIIKLIPRYDVNLVFKTVFLKDKTFFPKLITTDLIKLINHLLDSSDSLDGKQINNIFMVLNLVFKSNTIPKEQSIEILPKVISLFKSEKAGKASLALQGCYQPYHIEIIVSQDFISAALEKLKIAQLEEKRRILNVCNHIAKSDLSNTILHSDLLVCMFDLLQTTKGMVYQTVFIYSCQLIASFLTKLNQACIPILLETGIVKNFVKLWRKESFDPKAEAYVNFIMAASNYSEFDKILNRIEYVSVFELFLENRSVNNIINFLRFCKDIAKKKSRNSGIVQGIDSFFQEEYVQEKLSSLLEENKVPELTELVEYILEKYQVIE